jgi:predicted CopG family antitoxin
MPEIRVSEETLERLDGLRREGESHDELLNELLNIYEAGELTLSHAGDHVGPE